MKQKSIWQDRQCASANTRTHTQKKRKKKSISNNIKANSLKKKENFSNFFSRFHDNEMKRRKTFSDNRPFIHQSSLSSSLSSLNLYNLTSTNKQKCDHHHVTLTLNWNFFFSFFLSFFKTSVHL